MMKLWMRWSDWVDSLKVPQVVYMCGAFHGFALCLFAVLAILSPFIYQDPVSAAVMTTLYAVAAVHRVLRFRDFFRMAGEA